MTGLKDRIKARIETEGPLSVAQYMSVCLGDPDAGYYMTREPFGTAGDFVTAPEVSQMFGELVGAACLSAWQALGEPAEFQLVELGPGRGTLMSDLLRMAALRPAFVKAARLNLVETSQRLRDMQSAALKRGPLKPQFRDRFQDVPDGPLILVANEFFDALPIHQFVKTEHGWQERQIGLSQHGELIFGVGTARLPDDAVPAGLSTAPDGTIFETQPAANAIAEEIGRRIADSGGAALFIDYGYLKTAAGDTLQALYRHAYDDVLAHPGEADLTAHVNFEALAAAAVQAGARALAPLTQGEFLLRTGLLERAGALGAGKTHSEQEAIRDAVERLAAPDQMGDLFKVLAVTNSGNSFPPFDSAS
ncbi:class I SAM-dependent methyltransferase [Roseibium aggregatum]|uniref:class I SAM-dependent methyltransferase n=1 Tax=Roseibium aggregatum TaxID=187304 RepID=UPI001A8C92B0|nr:class I SAM-dependent methyltransferase [Roseibium aggregatum]MBN8181621.1 class I SAM-dependent methyltransferase [Roseibium aggregatum]UES43502.1 class I SAM-dependent methyltransferase [Roseibium aggregatum]